MNPGTLVISVVATHHTQYELKRQYDKNLHIFNETRGLERALIQQLVLEIEAKYINAMRNRTTGKFYVTLFILIQYLIIKYGKISPSQFINLKKEENQCNTIPRAQSIMFLTKSKTSLNMENFLEPCKPKSKQQTLHTPSSTRLRSLRMQ